MPPIDFDYDIDDIDDLIGEDEAMQAGAFEESPEDVQTSTTAANDVEEYDYEEEGEEEEDDLAEECVRRRGVRRGVGRVNYAESDEDSADGSDANSVAEDVASPVPSMEGVADDASMPSAPTSGHASDESDADGVDVLRSELLYTDNESDWATAEQKALQLGRDAAWFKEVKRKRDELMKALGQVEGANSHAVVLGLEWDASNQQRASAARRLSKMLHPDKHPNAPEAFAKRLDLAFKRVIEARDADDFAAAVPRTRTEKQRDKETARMAAAAEKRQAQRAKAEAASKRATNFQQRAMGRIKAPERAINGITPWVPPGGKNGAQADPIKVELAKVDSCKVPAFGSLLKTVDGNEVEFLPAARTTLLMEAGCSAEKTRQLIKWILKELETNPDLAIIFVTCRKTHADDLWTTLKGFGLDFVNYRDATGKAESKTAYMAEAKWLIVSLQSLHLVDPSLYVDGLVVVDEIRSAFSIPGGETLPQPVLHMQGAMRMLCEQAAYRVFMDADVSADGAVEAGIRLVAPRRGSMFAQQSAQEAMRGRFVAAGVADVQQHLKEAAECEHPEDKWAGASTLQPSLAAAVRTVAAWRESTQAERAWRVKRFKSVSRRLWTLTQELRKEFSPECVLEAEDVSVVHAALMGACVYAFDLDKSLVDMLVLGADAVGIIDPSNVYTPDAVPADVEFDELDHEAWNAWLLSDIALRAARASDQMAQAMRAVWAKTQSEEAKGYIRRTSLERLASKYGVGFWRAIRRFGVVQGTSVRACENAAESAHNAASALSERLTCETADLPVRIAAAFAAILDTDDSQPMPFNMQVGTEDLEAAYRRVLVSTPQYTVVAVWDTDAEEVALFEMPGYNFGLHSAVLSFNRVAHSLCEVARRLFAVCTGHYYDDFVCAEPDFALGSGQDMLCCVLRAMGLPASTEKHVAMSRRGVFLGVLNDFSQMRSTRVVSLATDAEKQRVTLLMVESARSSAKLSPMDVHWPIRADGGGVRVLLAPRAGGAGGSALRGQHERAGGDGQGLFARH